ncbi:alpha/beta-hydrolase [Marasmius fiardii PR-910]|nr:alpha/beta-hydrolase [Marasmius fiardii PR-910]
MLRLFGIVALLVALTAIVVASPTPGKRQSITILSAAQVAAYKPYAFYAAAAFCQPANTLAWNCGGNCQANPTFKPLASGGDGGFVQFWYVGYDPTLKTVIVGHQGTDPSKIIPLITDIDILLGPLNPSLFPGVSPSVKVHNGFRDEQAKFATQVLTAVQQALSANSADTVTVVGTSLGAALALVNAVYLRLQLPSAVAVKVISYGSPRVGNKAFADLVDSLLPGMISFVTNKKDYVPTFPPQFLGYAHPNGELHIKEDNTWASCPGHDNPDPQCIVGAVPTIFMSNFFDHPGPYGVVEMGC